MEKLKVWFRSLEPRERLLVSIGGGLIALLLGYFAVIRPVAMTVASRQARIERKQQDLAWMRSTANTVRMLAASQPNSSSGESLVVLVNRTAQQSGLATALSNQAPAGENSLRLRVEGGSFDAMVTWFAMLENQYAVRVETASIDSSDKPGIVNASLVLTRAH